MSATEQGMWRALRDAADLRREVKSFARVESAATRTGITDAEYVVGGWHGWLEFKVCTTQRDTARVAFGHEFTWAQAQWLLDHHDPAVHLRSWLIIGHPGPARWREWWAVTAPSALRLVTLTPSPRLPTLSHVRALATEPRKSGIFVVPEPGRVLDLLAGRLS